VAALGILASMVVFSPGHLDSDTSSQLNEAQNFTFSNWHPPFLAFLWSIFLKILPGAWGPFLLISICYWLGLTLVIHNLFPGRPRTAAALTFIIGFLPPMWSVTALVWKDAMFGATLLTASGLALHHRNNSRRAFWWPLPFLIIATLVRHNSVVATAPLLAALVWPFLNSKSGGNTKLMDSALKFAIFITCGLSLWVVQSLTDLALTTLDRFPPQVVYVFDLSGISVESDKFYFPSEYATNLENLKRIFEPGTVYPLLFLEEGRGRPGFVFDGLSPIILETSWSRAILAEPQAYLRHRLKFYRSFLGLDFSARRGRIYFEEEGIPAAASPARVDNWGKAYVSFAKTFEAGLLFRPFLYLIMLGVSAVFLWWLGPSKEKEELLLTRALWWSAFLYLISYLPSGVASDYRYAWWSCLISLVTLAKAIEVWLTSPQMLARTSQDHKRFLSSVGDRSQTS
jgi:hypothetical protein